MITAPLITVRGGGHAPVSPAGKIALVADFTQLCATVASPCASCATAQPCLDLTARGTEDDDLIRSPALGVSMADALRPCCSAFETLVLGAAIVGTVRQQPRRAAGAP